MAVLISVGVQLWSEYSTPAGPTERHGFFPIKKVPQGTKGPLFEPIQAGVRAYPTQNCSTWPGCTALQAPMSTDDGDLTRWQEHQDLDDVPNAKPYPSKKKLVEARGRAKTKKTTFFQCKVHILAVGVA